MKCPICKAPVDDASRDTPGSAFPFCSERCKLIDLGRWLSDAYQIPVSSDDTDSDVPPAAPSHADE